MIMNIKILKDFLWGFQRGINYHSHTSSSSGMKPTCLELMVTSKCNARCTMCNIWKSNHKNDLSLNDIEPIFSSSVLSDIRLVIISGGEPFLSNDLLPIIECINSELPKLQEIDIFSNGLRSDHIVSQTKKALEVLRSDIRLRVGISFDGIGESHDQVRNIKGIHDFAVSAIKNLQEIKDERLFIQAHVTIGPFNIDQLGELRQYLNGIVKKVAWFPIIYSDSYFNNLEEGNNSSFYSKSKDKIVKFYKLLYEEEPPSPSRAFHK